jgi:hypothetical protein
LRKQFAAVGVQLQVRTTDYNQFQTKVLQGIFSSFNGAGTRLPGPGKLSVPLYGPNAKVTSQGENAANYDNPRFNELFRRAENMVNSAERAAVIRDMLAIAQEDAPWIWGSILWAMGSTTPGSTIRSPHLRWQHPEIQTIDPDLREQGRVAWNRPITGPLWGGLTVLILATIPATVSIYRRQRRMPQP